MTTKLNGKTNGSKKEESKSTASTDAPVRGKATKGSEKNESEEEQNLEGAPSPDSDENEEEEEETSDSSNSGGGNAAALAAATNSGGEMSASFKNFRHHPDMENFYRFIYENDLRQEALTILNEMMVEKQQRKLTKGPKVQQSH